MSDAPRLHIDVRMQNHSGIGTYLRNVVRRILPEFAPDSYRLVGGAPGDAFDVPASQRIAHRSAIYSIGEQFAPLRFGVRRHDLYWSPHYNFPPLLRCRHLVTVHDALFLAMPELADSALKQFYARTLFAQVSRRAEKIICVSRATADELIRLTGVAASKLEVVYNGVDPAWFGPRAATRPLPGPYFLFVGNVKPHKNLRALIAAMQLLAEKHPEHQLVIVGKRDGFITGDAEAVREAEQLPGRVTFTGFISEDALRSYYQHAEALVFPSLYEGFGLPLIEAMACGCPVAASDIPVHREIAGNAALFFDPYTPSDIAAKMAQIIAQPAELRREVFERARTRAQTFSWDRCARETLSLIRTLLP